MSDTTLDDAELTPGTRAYRRRYDALVVDGEAHRNRPGGFWVASADPEAAAQALTGSVPLGAVRRFAVLTDGAARLVDPFGVMTWTACLDLLADSGPRKLVQRVRAAEDTDPDGPRWQRRKRHADATAVFCRP